MNFEEWYTHVFGGHISNNQATNELRVAYDYYVENEQLRNNVKGLRYHLSQTTGRRGVCLEFDGKDMTDVYELQREIAEKDAIINFLKKELAKKFFCRQVMKRQYRELRQKYDAVKPRVEVQVELKEHRFAYFDITNWSKEEAEELLKKWKEIERRNK